MNVEELHEIAGTAVEEREKFDYEINVCMGTGCLSQHSDKVKAALEKAAEGSEKKCHVRRTGCMGLCAAGPLVLVEPAETRYGHVHEDDAKDVVASLGKDPVARLDPQLGGYFDGQTHVVLENSGHIDPEEIDEYIAPRRLRGLVKALTRHESVLGDRANLQKRAARAWRRRLSHRPQVGHRRQGRGAQKYVICNGDEGDPGAFMDRSVLESDPQRVHRRHGHCRLRRRRQQRLYLCPRRISSGRQAA